MEHETYWTLMQSLPHWGFEITLELLSGVIVYPLVRLAHNRLNDRLHRELDAEHGVVHGSPEQRTGEPISHVKVAGSTSVFVK